MLGKVANHKVVTFTTNDIEKIILQHLRECEIVKTGDKVKATLDYNQERGEKWLEGMTFNVEIGGRVEPSKPAKGFKYGVGTLVKVTNPGHLYSTYYDMFRKMGFSNYEDSHRIKGDKHTTYKVFKADRHISVPHNPLYGLEDTETGYQILMEESGIGLAEE